ncbi:hypothetical protein EON64_20185, partial [archaeon]
GKTFTMTGGAGGAHRGIIGQAVQLVFETIGQYPDREFLLRVSYLEVDSSCNCVYICVQTCEI